jgi:hypothetical protein
MLYLIMNEEQKFFFQYSLSSQVVFIQKSYTIFLFKILYPFKFPKETQEICICSFRELV